MRCTPIYGIVTLWETNITMENHHLQLVLSTIIPSGNGNMNEPLDFLWTRCSDRGPFEWKKQKHMFIENFRILKWRYVSTSSTAQGGGGSFKNRKPIGEIGCCESEMAERSYCWTERRLISLTLSLTIYLPTYLSSCVV